MESSRIAARLAGRRIVVALSGGMDSVCLTHLLVRGGADVRAAHVDHDLRPDSADDAAFCANLAASLGIPFALARLDVERGNSTQGRARVQRYAALIRLACELGGDVLAVAHHADDAWESSQLQLERGAGPVGAAGPQMWSQWWGFDVARPLLLVRRAELDAYAAREELTWRDDPTNRDPQYARVRVRQSEASFDADVLADRRAAAATLSRAAAGVDPLQQRPTAKLFDRRTLRELADEVVARVLLDAARTLHGELSAPQVADLLAAVGDEETRPRWFCGRRVAVEVSSAAVSLHASRGQGTRLLDDRATAAVSVRPGMKIPWFDRPIVVGADCDGLTLRGPRPGDRIDGRPVGDLLSELGVPPADRWRWPCFEDHGELAIVGGHPSPGEEPHIRSEEFPMRTVP